MNTRRLIAGIAVTAAASLALTSCAGTTPAPGEDPAGADAATVQFATWQFLEPNRGDALYAALQSYPGADIEKVEVARADYEKQMSTQIGAGTGPDILVIPDAFFPELAAAGVLEPLDDVIAAASPRGFRDINDAYAWNGNQLGVVWEVVPYGLFWNKNILEEAGVTAPTDVDSLIAAANAITENTGHTGFTVRHQMAEETPWWTDHSNWEFGFGGAWSDGTSLTINSAKNVEAVEAYQKVYNAPGFGKGQDASTYRSAFKSGALGMAIDNSSAVMTLLGEAVQAEDVGSAVLPFPGGGSAYAGFSIGVNANGANKEAALKMIEWLIQADAQQLLADTLFPSAVATEIAPDAALTAAHPWTDAFFEQVKDSSSVVIPGFEQQTPEIRTIVLTQIERALTEGISAQEALDTAQAQAEALG